MKYIIGWGLSGGFGGISEYTIIKAKNEEGAFNYAYDEVCEHYQSYEGMYGLPEYGECLEEAENDEDVAYEIYNEHREGWIETIVIPWTKEKEDELREKGYL